MYDCVNASSVGASRCEGFLLFLVVYVPTVTLAQQRQKRRCVVGQGSMCVSVMCDWLCELYGMLYWYGWTLREDT